MFFPTRGVSLTAVKDICKSCPVVKPCLEYSMRTVEKFGVWGGTSERERRKMRGIRRRVLQRGEDIDISTLLSVVNVNISTLKESELEPYSLEDYFK